MSEDNEYIIYVFVCVNDLMMRVARSIYYYESFNQ